MNFTPSPEKKLLLLGLLTALICTLSYFYFDRAAIEYFLAVDPEIIAAFKLLTEGGDSLYSLLIGGLAFLIGQQLLRREIIEKTRYWAERAKIWGGFLFTSVALSGLCTNLIKMLLGRARPVKLLTENLYGFQFFQVEPKLTSFPSGHSDTAMATALVLWYLWPRSWPLGLLLAVGVMLSRVAVLKHFPSDTLAGAYLAVVTTYYIQRWFKRRYPQFFPASATK